MRENIAAYCPSQVNLIGDDIAFNYCVWFNPEPAAGDAPFDFACNDDIIVRDDGATNPYVLIDEKRLFSQRLAPDNLAPALS